MAKNKIMKSILNRVQVHPLFYLVTLIMILTGLFKPFILFIFIIITHEIGHILASLIFKWQIEKIILLPFGGLIIFNEDINRPLIQELIITLMGPIFQVITLLIFPKLQPISIPLLFFNLIPIYPLDGFKLLNILINKIMPFKLSYGISLYLSFIITPLLILTNHNLIFILSLILIFIKTYLAYKERGSYFNRFLLERHLKHFSFKKNRIINGIKVDKMYRDYHHVFIYRNEYYLEEEILQKWFDFKGEVC